MKAYTFIVIFLIGASISAQDLIPRTDLFSNPTNSNVQMNYDGTKVAFISNNGQAQILKIKNIDSDEVVDLKIDGDILNYQWSYQNSLIVQTKNEDEFVLQNIQPDHNVTTLFKWQQSFRVLPLSALKKEDIIIAAGSNIVEKSGIYSVNLTSGKSYKLYDLGNYNNWYFDGQYELKAAVTQNAQYGHDLYLFDSNQSPRLFKSYPFDATYLVGNPVNAVAGISLDGNYIYFTDNLTSDKTLLKSYSFVTNEEEVIVEDVNADLFSGSTTFGFKNNIPTSIATFFGKSIRYFMDTKLESDIRTIENMNLGDVGLIRSSIDNSKHFIRLFNGGPFQYFVYNSKSKKLKKIISEYPHLDKYNFSKRKPFYVSTNDSLILPCQIFLPVGSDSNADGIPDKPLPTILYVHGGPWIGLYHNNWLINRHLQLLANRGYAIINTDFRGTTGYGKIFQDKSHGEFGGKMHDDLIDILNYAIENKIAKKESVSIFGWSYGGYAVSYAMGKKPDAFACGINLYGVNDLEEFVKTPLWSAWVGDPNTEEGKNKLKQHSPMTWVKDIKNPMLVSHGAKDNRVPLSQSNIYVNELKKYQKEVIYTVYPDEGHDYMSSVSWVGFWAYAEQFLKQHLDGLALEIGSDLDSINFEWKEGKSLIEHMTD